MMQRLVGVENSVDRVCRLRLDKKQPLWERSIFIGSRGDLCCSRKCLALKLIPASRLVVRT